VGKLGLQLAMPIHVLTKVADRRTRKLSEN